MREGWTVQELGLLCDILDSKRKPITKSDRIEGEYPYYGATGILGYVDGFIFNETLILIGEDGAKWEPGARSAFIAEGKYWVNNHAHVIRPLRNVVADNWIIYFLNYSDLLPFVTGLTVPKLNQEKLKSIPIPVPPIDEQKALVKVLDEAFAIIDKVKAAIEKNLRNARELFEGYLESVFANGGEGWEEMTLVDVCEVFFDSAHRTPKYQTEGIPALRPRDVVNGELDLNGSARVSNEEYEIQTKRYKPRPGDFVYSRELSYGWAAILPENNIVCLSQGMCIFRPSSKVNSTYLHYILNGSFGRNQARKVAVGASHPHINLGDIKSYRIPVAPIKTQDAIVKQLDTLSSKIIGLEHIYRTRLAALEELKKSILQKAFAGELTKVSESGFTGLEDVHDAASVGKVHATLDIPIRTRVIEMPLMVPNIAATDLQAGITAYAFKKHLQAGQKNTFHHVKAEKIAHLVESHVFIELGRTPMKNVAGPNDYPHAKKVESRAAKAGFYTVRKDGDHYVYTMGKKSDELVEKVKDRLGEKFESVTRLIDLMLPLNTRQSEIVATVYAGWNNLLSDGVEISDEAIVYESRENWTESKLNIPREDFFKWLEWMRKNELVPRGVGKKVLHKTAKK